ncbi:MAG: BON domain-containing protein [Gemmataceae bacterium]|nr:BON domain-containing protein [Gemmataceae bacterium]MDW8266537.1 BON domain-containing protein [Gemmataceae bacterium]
MLRPTRRLLWLAVVSVSLAARPLQAANDSPVDDLRLNDCLTTLRARDVLARDPVLGPLNLGVSVQSGVATLWGAVPSAAPAWRAGELLSQVAGVLEVRNALEVISPDDPWAEIMAEQWAGMSHGAEPKTPTVTPLRFAALTGRAEHGSPSAEGRPPHVVLLQPVPVTLLPPVACAAEPPRLIERVEALRRGEGPLADLRTEVQGGVVRFRGVTTNWEALIRFVQTVARLPGVERVVLEDVRRSAP